MLSLLLCSQPNNHLFLTCLPFHDVDNYIFSMYLQLSNGIESDCLYIRNKGFMLVAFHLIAVIINAVCNYNHSNLMERIFKLQFYVNGFPFDCCHQKSMSNDINSKLMERIRSCDHSIFPL